MIRTRIILLSLLAAFALSVVASASASAAECKKEATKKFILCLGEPLILTEGTLTIHIKTDPNAKYTLTTAGLKLLSSTILEALGSLTSLVAPSTNNVTIQGIVLHFTGVTVDEAAHCKVFEELVKTELLSGTVENNEKEKVLFRPTSGEIFATVKLEGDGTGTCVSAGSFKVHLTTGKGGVLCTSPIEVTRVEQLFECKSSELLFGENTAEFTGNFLSTVLKNGAAEKWAIIEGK